MDKDFKTTPNQTKIEKPWGYELILTLSDSPVVGKIEHVYVGKRCSFQYHDQKIETLTLIEGEAMLLLEDEKGNLEEIRMELKKGYLIKPFQKHRFTGITDCDIVEHSTGEIGNTVRLEDDYQRPTETEETRKTRTAGKIYNG
ncbi:MAG: cupin [bacterium]|nr:cupin [bacterium]